MIDNLLTEIKNSVKNCIKKDNQFTHIPFLDSAYNLSPNSFNSNKPILIVGLNEITDIHSKGICGKEITQVLTIEYHTKADNKKKDWESDIGRICLKIIKLIEDSQNSSTLFTKDVSLEFVYANTGRFRREENNKDKILSHAGVIKYNCKYNLDEVL